MNDLRLLAETRYAHVSRVGKTKSDGVLLRLIFDKSMCWIRGCEEVELIEKIGRVEFGFQSIVGRLWMRAGIPNSRGDCITGISRVAMAGGC